MDCMWRHAFIVLALCGSAWAGTTDPQHPDARYVEHGRQFSTFTLQVEATDGDGVIGVGTCVAIADRWLLTAAHIVHDASRVCVVAGEKRWRVERWHLHGFDVDRMGHADISLLESEPLGLERYAALADGTEKVGDAVDVAGYGFTGRLTTGWTHCDGQLRAGTNTIARSEDGVWVCHGAAGTSPLEMLTAPGDSGGPLFVRGRVAGIHSTVQRNGRGKVRSTNGQESCHTRVADHLEWITRTMSR